MLMSGVAIVIMLVMCIVVMLGVVFFYLGGRMGRVRSRLGGVECGFDVKSDSRVAFSLRFFLLTVIFLVFDVEIVILLPVPFLVGEVEQVFICVIFFGVLLLGLVYEWFDGSLDWEM